MVQPTRKKEVRIDKRCLSNEFQDQVDKRRTRGRSKRGEEKNNVELRRMRRRLGAARMSVGGKVVTFGILQDLRIVSKCRIGGVLVPCCQLGLMFKDNRVKAMIGVYSFLSLCLKRHKSHLMTRRGHHADSRDQTRLSHQQVVTTEKKKKIKMPTKV